MSVHAMHPEEDLPEEYEDYLQFNIEYAAKWPLITEGHEPLETAEEFKDVKHKRDLFDPSPAPRDE